MNDSIGKIVFEMIITIIFLIVSIPLFDKIRDNNNKGQELLKYSSNYAINLEKGDNDKLFPMSDEYALNNISPSKIAITNNNKNRDKYVLYLSIDKKSTLDTGKLRVRVNNEIHDLSNLYSYEDENNVYYTLTKNNTSNELVFNIWINDTVKDLSNDNLIYNFVVI